MALHACPGVQDDAKLAFKQLMGSVGMRSDWGWDQTLRLIASDPRRALQPVQVSPPPFFVAPLDFGSLAFQCWAPLPPESSTADDRSRADWVTIDLQLYLDRRKFHHQFRCRRLPHTQCHTPSNNNK